MPFLPDYYTVKRNYSRVFQCSFLAKFMGNQLVVTDICRDLANADGELPQAAVILQDVLERLLNEIPQISDE